MPKKTKAIKKIEEIKESKELIPQLDFNSETLDLIKKTITAFNPTDAEFQMFIYQAKRSGLDPLARQIYMIKRGDKVNIQASIDGLRLVAQRNGDYAGQDEPVWEYDNEDNLKVAKVTVYKFSPTGQRYPAAVGVAEWKEYKPAAGQDFMWLKMPKTMLAKVAEALALRKAFPQELSGIYTTEEMAQDITPTSRPTRMATEKQIKYLASLLTYKGKDKELIYAHYKIESLKDLTFDQCSRLIEKLVLMPDVPKETEEELPDESQAMDEEVDIDSLPEDLGGTNA